MGNCMDLQKPVTWVDDDDDFWGAMEDKSSGRHGKQKDRAQLLLAPAEEKGGSASTEIKIKISKKQLEELLRRADDGKVLPLQQVLADLVSMGETDKLHDQERHWRPRLQSIPEVPEYCV